MGQRCELFSGAASPAALWEANAAMREAIFANPDAASRGAAAALAIAPESRDTEIEAALAYAFAGDSARGQSLAGDLAKSFPENTVVQSVWLPTVRAELALARKDPAQSIELLQRAASYELGLSIGSANNSCLYPLYVRGQAYISAGQGLSAAAEFQKVLDKRGLVWNCPTGALAHLGLGRSFALAAASVHGDEAQNYKSKARAAYQDFLTLWKDADPDIPILIAAKSEYAKLK